MGARQEPRVKVLVAIIVLLLCGSSLCDQNNGAATVVVRSGSELALALAASDSPLAVREARMANSFNVTDADWRGLPFPVVIASNFTICGMEGLPYPPTLALLVRAKIQLVSDATLILYGIVLSGARTKLASLSPGLDLVMQSPPGQRGFVVVRNITTINRMCFPMPYRAQSVAGFKRAAGYPGENTFTLVLPQTGCVNSSAAPPTVRCWADKGAYLDVAVDAVDMDAADLPIAMRYVMDIRDSVFACAVMLSLDCIQRWGPIGCVTNFMLTLLNGTTNGTVTTVAAPAPPSPAPPSELAGGDSANGPRHPALLVPLLVGIIGGLVVLAAIVVGVVALRPSRRVRYHSTKGALPLPVERTSTGAPIAPIAVEPSAACGKGSENSTGDECVTCESPNEFRSSNTMDASLVTPLTPQRTDATDPSVARELTLLPVLLGKGAFGRVVMGNWDGQRVAVKLIGDMGFASADADVGTLHQEIEVLGRCQHPNVVRLLAASLVLPRPCLVMELCECSLQRLLYGSPGTLLPIRKVVNIAIGIARGLEYLHPTIIHRDLKPANVLLNDATSDCPAVKLTDFGLSRLRSTVLVTNHPEAGTPSYMAPECFDPNNYTLTCKADCYSLGVLLAEMIAGQPPWPGLSMVELATGVTLRGKRPYNMQHLGHVRCPRKLAGLINHLWDADPLRRPAAAEAAKTLELIRETTLDEPAAPPTGVPVSIASFFRAKPA